MICLAERDRLLLITQPDHAQLAGRIMERCVPLADHRRRDSILRACAEHDDGWIEVDAAPEIDHLTGHVIDFMTAPSLTKQSVWPRAVARLAADPWAAALVAMHAVTVYSRYQDDLAWASFFPDMTGARDALVRESGGAIAELEADYPFVRLADLISLTFCNRWTEPQGFGGWMVRGAGTQVTVSPDAFGGAQVQFHVAARSVPLRRYASTDQLRDAIRSASLVSLAGTVSAE
jgi:Protein of unknown function (DUF3891)